MMESSNRQGKAAIVAPAHAAAAFSESHADLLELFGRWEVLADSDSDPRVETAPTPSCNGAARPR